MTDWSFLLAPLAVLAGLLFFRLVGCASFLSVDDVSYAEGPSGYDSLKDVAVAAYSPVADPTRSRS